jgi:hypothetical protein
MPGPDRSRLTAIEFNVLLDFKINQAKIALN